MRWKADLILLFVAALWGSGFIAQRYAAEQMNTFYFNGGRFLAAGLILWLLTRFQKQPAPVDRNHQRWIVLAGVLLFAAAGLQQAGLATTSIGNASFITGLYVVLVPVILFVFLRKKISWLSWLAVTVAAVGVGLLSLQGSLILARGDLLVMLGAVMWALHVILVGYLAGWGVDVQRFSIIQFMTCGLLNFILALALEPAGVSDLAAGWQPVLYSALFPVGLGFSLQIAGQRHAPAVDAAILLSMEAVFATVFAYLILNELLTVQQMLGCLLILAAMILAQARPGAEQPEVGELGSA